MDILSNLLILALFSLHQYIPSDQLSEKYFESAVQPETLEFTMDSRLIVASAHQTCRYFFSSAQQDFQMTEQELINLIFSLIEQKESSISEFSSTSTHLKKTIRDICRKDFKWSSFPDKKMEQIAQFLKTELLILTTKDLMRFGQMDLFGRTTLYDRNGIPLGSLYSSMDRWLSLSQISPYVPKALIAAEDKTFMTHHGVELSSFTRILFQMKSDNDSISGGSTLTMQLLKNFYFMNLGFNSSDAREINSYRAQSILRKIREWFWAKPFENFLNTQYPSAAKEKILEYYLNLMDYGPQIRGIDRAAHIFFNKTAVQLTISESAFMATLFKAPQKYSLPKNYVEYTIPRREYVLKEMSTLNWQESLIDPISKDEMQLSLKEPLPNWVETQKVSSETDPETLHLQTLSRDTLFDFYEKHPNVLPVESEIISTIDSNLQKIVYNVVQEQLDTYDSARNKLNRIGPARDDRTRIAKMGIQDIPSSINNLIDDFRKSFSASQVDIAILIGSGKSIEDTEIYFSSQNIVIKDKPILASLINKQSLKGRSISVLAISTNDSSCKQNSTNGEINIDILSIPTNCIKILDKSENHKVLEKNIADLIKIQFLKRMLSNSQRESIIPSFFDEETQRLVVLKEANSTFFLEPISLKQEYHNFFRENVKRGIFRHGQIFWVSSKDGITYNLEANKLQAAVVVMDSEKGDVYAHFGGYRPENSRFFDRSRSAKRQPGSTLKPWLYYLALNKGFNENSIIRNQGVVFPMPKAKNYVPDNFPGSSAVSEVTLKEAFKNSYNKAAVGLLTDDRFGPEPQENLQEFVNFLTEIEMYSPQSVQIQPSIVLGAQEVSVLDLTSSFTFFANGKRIVKPSFFRSIKNGQGISIYQNNPPQKISVPYSENQWAVDGIQRLMIEVANYGTARKLLNFPYKTLGLKNCDGASFGIVGQICFAGKTGTSSDLKDNWFVGTSRNFTIGVWVGYDYRESTGATGGELALPIFMKIVEQGRNYLPPIEPILSQ